MTKAQKLALRLSETRQALNALSAIDGEKLSDEQRAEMAVLAESYPALETEWRAAAIVESDDPPMDPANEGSGEGAERRALIERVELRGYLAEAATGAPATGAEHELRAAVFGESARSGLVPWEALLPPRQEQRADAATSAPADVGASQAEVLGRVFADTSAAYLGVEMPQVPVGEANYPVLSAGVSPSTEAKGAVKDAEAATISATVLSPRRLTARYLFAVEDAVRLRGLESSLRQDLASALGEAMDDQIINGNGTAPNVSGLVASLTAPANPTAISAFSDFVSSAAGAVDGRFARNLTGVRTLVGPQSYQLAASVMSAGAETALADYMIARSGGFLASALIAKASVAVGATLGVQDAILYRAFRGQGSAVAPIWDGLQLIRDPYTDAASGRVSITAVMLWNFAILRKPAYARAKFKVV